MAPPYTITYSKWLWGPMFLILVAGISVFAYTGYYWALALPFIPLYVVLMGLNWKGAYWLLLLSVPASVQLEFMDNSLSSTLPDEPMMWLFLVLVFILLISKAVTVPQWWWRNPMTTVVLMQMAWLVVSVIFSKVLLLSVKFVIAKTWFLCCFFLLPVWIFRKKKDFKTGFLLLFFPILVTTIIITIRHAVKHFEFLEVNRAIGTLYYNHIEYSAVLAMFYPLLCIAYPLSKGRSKWIRALLMILIVAFVPILILTYARSAILGVVFAFIVGLAIRLKLVNFIMPVFYGLVALLLVYMIRDNKYLDFRPNYHQTYMHTSFSDHLIATFRGEDMSSMERLYRWIAGIRMSNDNPVTGVGPHGFVYHYKPYAVNSFKTYVSRNDEHSTTHNYFLYMLTEQGWPAMLLYALLNIVVLAQAQKIYHRFKDRFYRACTMAMAMSFAASFIINFFSELIETHKAGSIFYLSLALLVILHKKSKEEEAGLQVS